MSDRYLTTEEVAQRLNRSRRQVQQLIAQGRLLAARFGRAYMVHETTLDSFSLRPSGPRPKIKTEQSTST